MLSKDLSTRIIKQEIQLSSETDVQNIKRKIKSQKQQKHQAKLENIRSYLTEEQIRLNKLNQEHGGSSSWLTTLPLSIRRIRSHKTAILGSHSNSLWMDTKIPAYCECGEIFNLQHVLCLARKMDSYHCDTTSSET